MNARYLPSLSLVMLTIGALGVFVVGFAYGYEADPAGPPPDRPRAVRGEPVPGLPLPDALVDAHLAFLKTALKVADAQTPAWNAVAGVLHDQAERRDAEMMARRKAIRDTAGPPDLPDMLQERQRMAVVEADDLSKLLIALKPFYVMLSAEQKETADRLFPADLHGPGMGRPGLGGPPGPREDEPECQPFLRHEAR